VQRFKKVVAIGVILLIVAAVFQLGIPASAELAAGDRYHIILKDGLYGYIDSGGKVVVRPQFAFVRNFSEELAVAKPVGSEMYGYIDKTGNFVIPPQFKQAYDFSEGLAAVDRGYIDKQGSVVISRPGDPFHNGRARQHGKPASIIDKTGKVILDTQYDEVWETKSELIAFIQDGKMGFMTWDKKVVIQPRYQETRYRPEDLFGESITPVNIRLANKSKWGFIDKSGNTAIEFEYDWAEQFQEGLAVVGKGKLYGYMGSDGRLAIPLRFENAGNFNEGLAAVQVDGLWGFIDKEGNMVIKPEYLGLMWGSPLEFHEGLAAVRTPNGTGFINKAGEMVIAPVYRTAEHFSDGIAEVYFPNGLKGYVSQAGEYVWEPSR